MLVIIAYDINVTSENGEYRLRRISKICTNVGHRIQESVYECLINSTEYKMLLNEINSTIDPELDKVRIYRIGDNWKDKIETLGVNDGYDPQGLLII